MFSSSLSHKSQTALHIPSLSESGKLSSESRLAWLFLKLVSHPVTRGVYCGGVVLAVTELCASVNSLRVNSVRFLPILSPHCQQLPLHALLYVKKITMYSETGRRVVVVGRGPQAAASGWGLGADSCLPGRRAGRRGYRRSTQCQWLQWYCK